VQSRDGTGRERKGTVMIRALNSSDTITISLFGRETEVEVFSTGAMRSTVSALVFGIKSFWGSNLRTGHCDLYRKFHGRILP
jgi:hypothetical protein